MTQVITLHHVWTGYGTTPILEDINLVVNELEAVLHLESDLWGHHYFS